MDPVGYLLLDESSRRVILNKAHKATKTQAFTWLKAYQTSSHWTRFQEGFLRQGKKLALEEVYSYHLCPPSASRPFHLDEEALRVKLCSNLIPSEAVHTSHLDYLNVRLYDLVRLNDTPKCEQRVCTEIRAAKISGLATNREELQQRVTAEVFSLPECVHKSPLIFDQVFAHCYADSSPLNSFSSLADSN